jgi:NRPS condensation-like uncharacterized protein
MAVLHDTSPFTLHMGLQLDGALDHERLRRALDRLTHRHPILTATVDPSRTDARWEPGTTRPELREVIDDPGDRFLSASARAALAARTLDVRAGPTCSVAHIHDASTSRSRLVFGLHHAVADARGTLLLLDDLRIIYVALQQGDAPTVDVDWSFRTLGALVDARGERFDVRTRRGWDVVRRWTTTPRSTHREAAGPARSTEARADDDGNTAVFDDALIDTVDVAARRHGWRLNHVTLALIARAWSRLFGREPVEPSVSGWLVTVDCRRQFAVERGVGNLSGLEPVSLIDIEAQDLLLAIDQTRAAFGALARDGAGLAAEMLAAPVPMPPVIYDRAMRDTFALRTRTYRLSRLYTTAVLRPTLAQWGHTEATALRWISPDRIAPPYVTLALLRFGGETTITSVAAPEVLPPESATALAHELRAGFEELAARL